MKILIVDRDRQSVETLQGWLEAQGHDVVAEPVRKTAFDLINQQPFDLIAIDPAPLSSVRQIALPLRWEQREQYFYLVLMGHEQDNSEVIRNGMNNAIVKPFHEASLTQVLQNAQRLTGFMKSLQTGKMIEPPESRLFGQRPFYQLVLSALDRAYRYGEQAYLLHIKLTNMEALTSRLGPEQAAMVLMELGKYLVKLCRISDFLGHTEATEFVLLLLRPAVDREPQDAAERFAMALRDFQSQLTHSVAPQFSIELWSLPSAALEEHIDLP